MLMLAIAGLYIFLSVETMSTGEPLKTKNKEKIRFIAVAIDHEAAMPVTPHLIPTTKAITRDEEVKRPQIR